MLTVDQSFKPEQEQQLVAWGCPPATKYYRRAGSLIQKRVPLQPHHVIEWLTYDFPDNYGLVLGINFRTWGAYRFRSGMPDARCMATAPDPYTAVFKLAHKVISAAHLIPQGDSTCQSTAAN